MSPRLGRARLKVVIGLAALVTGMLGGALALFEPAAQASVNLSCPQGTSEYKVDGNPLQGLSNGESAQFTVSGVTFTITKVAGADPFVDDTFDFTSTIAVSTVFVKGGLPTNVYDYDPAVTSGSGLHPPLNGGDEAPAISHVVFCIGTPGTTTTSTTAPSTSTSTSTTVPQTTTSTTVPQTTTSTTVPQTTTSTTVPQTTTSTTVPQTTTTTVPEETTTTTVPESTTTTVPEETTTSTTVVHGSTTIVTTTTEPTTTTVHEQGSTVPSSTTPRTVAPTGTLPFTGSGSAVAAMFGILCIAAGALLLASKRTRSHS